MGVSAAIVAGASVASAVVSYDAAQDAKYQSKVARQEAEARNAAAQAELQRQTEAQQRQAEVAAQRLEQEKAAYEAQNARYEQEKAKLESETAARTAELEAQRRSVAEKESARMKAARRGGTRSLLSEARLSPELGLTSTTDQYNQVM